MSRTFLKRCGQMAAFCFMLLVPAATVQALSNSTGLNGSNVQALHALDYNGQGVKIGFMSYYNSRTDHHAFFEKDENGNPIPGTSRVIIANVAGLSPTPQSHDTQMAGIMVSSGDAAEPNQIGVAPGATLYNTRAVDGSVSYSREALEELIVNRGCRVIVTGFMLGGDPSNFNGNTPNSLMYDYYAYHHNIVFANATGNYMDSYPYSTPPTSPGDAYNGITTGGLVRLSSDAYHRIGLHSLIGPTYDGRRKPEVAAPAPDQRVPNTGGVNVWTTTSGTTTGYTSWAAPHTAGVAAVLLGYAQTDGQLNADRSEVIKAVIVNSTFPNILAQNGTWTDPANVTWHTDRGYGRLDALRAYQTLSAHKITPGQTAADSKGWAYRDFSTSGLTDSYYIQAVENARLLTTVTWHRAATHKTSGPPHNRTITYEDESSPRLNLDLRIFAPGGVEIFADTGDSDNLRKADIRLPADGFYEVRITNTTSKANRAYALAFEVIAPLEGDLNTDYAVNTGDLLELADCWLNPCDLSLFQILAEQWLATDLRYAEPK